MRRYIIVNKNCFYGELQLLTFPRIFSLYKQRTYFQLSVDLFFHCVLQAYCVENGRESGPSDHKEQTVKRDVINPSIISLYPVANPRKR